MNFGNYFVYITTNPSKTTLYTGVTNDIYTRINEHYENKGKWKTFAGRYYCYNLVYFELHEDINRAIEIEKEIKNMSRKKKEALITSFNPKWKFFDVRYLF